MSLQFRLNLVITLSMFLIVSMGTLFTVYSARQSIHREILSSVNLFLQSIDFRLSHAEFADDSIVDWYSHITIPEQTRHLTVMLVPLDGQSTSPMKSQESNAPLSVPGWFVWWVKPKPLLETRVIKTRIGAFQLIIRDNPSDEIIEAWGEARGLFALIILQSLLIWMLVHTILGRVLKSVPVILNGLEHIESGDYKQRLPGFPLPEFSKISASFNHAASALEKAHWENRNLTRRSLTLQEEERRMISQELHDELGQSLTGIKAITTSIAKEHPTSQDAVDSILSTCDHLFSMMRSMMRRLRPTVLDELGLEASLEDMAGIWREQNPHTKVILSIDKDIENSNGKTNIHLFRIVQESLNNIARHAEATEVTISLNIEKITPSLQTPKSTILTIIDNGHGYNPDSIKPGFGLLGIRERAESLGGSFRLDTKPGHGTSIRVDIPCGELPA
ncbi:MAG: histidine kinase [Methylococcales bacterium]